MKNRIVRHDCVQMDCSCSLSDRTIQFIRTARHLNLCPLSTSPLKAKMAAGHYLRFHARKDLETRLLRNSTMRPPKVNADFKKNVQAKEFISAESERQTCQPPKQAIWRFWGKKAEKNREIGISNWEISKICVNVKCQIKMVYFLFHGISVTTIFVLSFLRSPRVSYIT